VFAPTIRSPLQLQAGLDAALRRLNIGILYIALQPDPSLRG